MSFPPLPPTPPRRNDRVSVLVDFNSYYCNEDESTLMGLEDYIRCYEFPNELTDPKNSITGFVGDPVYVRVPFWIDVTPSGGGFLENCTINIVATKDGEDDFLLEQKEFDTSNVRKYNNISGNALRQTIDIQDSKGYTQENFYDRANLIRNSGLDTSTTAYYELQYGFVLRYEDWLEVIQLAEGLKYAVFENVEDVTEHWYNYPSVGWDIKLKIEWNVRGIESDNITNFSASTDITVYELGDTMPVGEPFTCDTKYYTATSIEVDSILQDEDTYILSTFTGDTTILPSGYDNFYGYIFTDTTEGNVFNRRFANSEYDSEDSTPFTAGVDPGDALTTKADGQVRISVYADKIVLSTIFSNIQQQENTNNLRPASYLVYPRIGYYRLFCPILNEDGTIMLSEILEALLNEECP